LPNIQMEIELRRAEIDRAQRDGKDMERQIGRQRLEIDFLNDRLLRIDQHHGAQLKRRASVEVLVLASTDCKDWFAGMTQQQQIGLMNSNIERKQSVTLTDPAILKLLRSLVLETSKDEKQGPALKKVLVKFPAVLLGCPNEKIEKMTIQEALMVAKEIIILHEAMTCASNVTKIIKQTEDEKEPDSEERIALRITEYEAQIIESTNMLNREMDEREMLFLRCDDQADILVRQKDIIEELEVQLSGLAEWSVATVG
jgi:hypothetical protein